jgi:hypothetical protein
LTDDGVVRLPSARRLEIRFDDAPGELAGRVTRASTASAAAGVRMLGKLERNAELDELLGTRGRSDEELLRAIWERFGWGGFLRVSGACAAAIAGDEICVVRSPTFGAVRAIFHREMQDGLQFATDLASFERTGWNVASMRGWLQHRLWLPRGSTPFAGVSSLEPGAALIASRSGQRTERFWTFTPFAIPRLLAEEDARAEIEAAIRASVGAAEAELSAEAPALGLLSRLTGARPIDRRFDFGEAELRDAYRRLAWPVPLSEAAEVAALLRSDRPLVTDLGMREVMGATETALGAYVESMSTAFGESPRPSTLLGVLRAASPIDRRLVRSRLLPSLLDGALIAGNRWKRHLPPALASRISIDLPAEPIADPVTGDRYVDRRFAEALDPALAARHRALASARPVIAPFLDPRLVELAFSLPRPHFVGEGRILRAVDGGVPLAPFAKPKLPRYPDDHPYRSRPRRLLSELERNADEDRWLGLGAFLSAWEDGVK